MNFKREQLESKIKLLISNIIIEDLNVEVLKNNTSIIDVKLNKDLSHAEVFVNFLTKENDDAEREKMFKILDSKKFIIRNLLGRKIPFKTTPVIEFKIDHNIDQINRIEKIIENIS